MGLSHCPRGEGAIFRKAVMSHCAAKAAVTAMASQRTSGQKEDRGNPDEVKQHGGDSGQKIFLSTLQKGAVERIETDKKKSGNHPHGQLDDLGPIGGGQWSSKPKEWLLKWLQQDSRTIAIE